jgi:hypothetical protein
MIAGDPYKSGVAAVQDQANGRVAGYMACGGGISFEQGVASLSVHETAHRPGGNRDLGHRLCWGDRAPSGAPMLRAAGRKPRA